MLVCFLLLVSLTFSIFHRHKVCLVDFVDLICSLYHWWEGFGFFFLATLPLGFSCGFISTSAWVIPRGLLPRLPWRNWIFPREDSVWRWCSCLDRRSPGSLRYSGEPLSRTAGNMVLLGFFWASLVAQRLKRLPAMQETWVRSLGQEEPLEKEMATHSSILAWRIPWMEEPGGLQSMGSQRVGHNWATSLTQGFSSLWLLCPSGDRMRRWQESLHHGDPGNARYAGVPAAIVTGGMVLVKLFLAPGSSTPVRIEHVGGTAACLDRGNSGSAAYSGTPAASDERAMVLSVS